MKKFLVMLMVVAMASFLFVGCMPSVTPPVVEEEEVVVVPASSAPIITSIGTMSLSSTAAQYSNSLAVSGVGPIGAVVKLYINDVYVGTGAIATTGLFTITGAQIAVVKEGAKTLYVTATEYGLTESAPSTKYTFTYDTTAPKVGIVAFAISAATAGTSYGYAEVTFTEAVKGVTTTGVWVNSVSNATGPANVPVTATAKSATVAKLTEITAADIAIGDVLTITCPATIKDLAGNLLSTTVNFAIATTL
jgi:hypothetical protein